MPDNWRKAIFSAIIFVFSIVALVPIIALFLIDAFAIPMPWHHHRGGMAVWLHMRRRCDYYAIAV